MMSCAVDCAVAKPAIMADMIIVVSGINFIVKRGLSLDDGVFVIESLSFYTCRVCCSQKESIYLFLRSSHNRIFRCERVSSRLIRIPNFVELDGNSVT